MNLYVYPPRPPHTRKMNDDEVTKIIKWNVG